MVSLVIFMFLWLSRRIMVIGRQAIALEKVFSGLVAQGVGIWIGFQAFINMGVNLGALPTKGLTLPFMSYGGSALMMNLIAIAVVLFEIIKNGFVLSEWDRELVGAGAGQMSRVNSTWIATSLAKERARGAVAARLNRRRPVPVVRGGAGRVARRARPARRRSQRGPPARGIRSTCAARSC